MRVSVEFVPREAAVLEAELAYTKSNFSLVDTINIPDLLRFPIRSWEGCSIGKPYYKNLMPHLRAIDFNMNEPLPMADFLAANDIKEVLVVTGDYPQDMTRKIYPSTSVDMIRKFKKELPDIKVYAGIDQYRASIKVEVEYIRRKIDAGADGFFTQPFFDLRFMEMYAEMLTGYEVFWGVSPVISEKSMSYWETKNNVVFPKSFAPTKDWNMEFAKKAFAYTKATNTNIYFMPMRINIKEYLTGVFA
ncbi:MAG: methylenetetrahydrofolate reductase [Pelosinus sp.]|nr:methylenetetrahydrofolate reductase [Pelosinus sp.]